MLWLIFALLTIAVVIVLLLPLLRGEHKPEESRVAYDIVIYRNQLAEIDGEIAAGVLDKAQAAAARAEIHRRMLAAEDAELNKPLKPLQVDSRRAQLVAIVAIALIVPVSAAALYGALGSPQLPGKPYAWRVAHEPELAAAATSEALAEQLNARPSADGYRRLATMYFTARNFEQAAAADRRAIDLGANSAVIWSEYGEALAMSAGGMIVPEAMAAFTNALGMNPHDERSRFYVGLAEAQIGNLRQAVAIWRDLLATAAPDAPWADMVKGHIASFSKEGGFDPNSVTPSPPSVAALRTAVAGMAGAVQGNGTQSAGDDPQMAMIRTMVGRLAARMEQNQGDADGWRRLAHAYTVLGEKDKARAAIAHAVKLKPNDVVVLGTLAETEQAAAPPGEESPADFIATLHKVLKLDPANLQALYYVGLAEQKAGHEEAARALWNKALLGPNDPGDPLMIAIRNRLSRADGTTRR